MKAISFVCCAAILTGAIVGCNGQDYVVPPTTLGVAKLSARLQDPDWKMRAGAAEALGLTRDERALVPLTGALKDKNSRVRISAAEGLSHLGDVRAIWPLIHLVAEEEDAKVLEAATLAILRVGPEPMSPKLIESLREKLMLRTPEGVSDPSGGRLDVFSLFSRDAGISMTLIGGLFELQDLGHEDGLDKLFGVSMMQVLCRTIVLSRPKEPIAVYFTPVAVVTGSRVSSTPKQR